jgi:hypothetical protein
LIFAESPSNKVEITHTETRKGLKSGFQSNLSQDRLHLKWVKMGWMDEKKLEKRN